MASSTIHTEMMIASVRDCFGAFRWDGQALVVSEQSVAPLQSWETTSVQDFFRQYNWSGRSVLRASNGHSAPVIAPIITLPVKQFFDRFIWDGLPTIAPQPIVSASYQPEQRDFKLANFSNLF
jgi:hypothetical protein